jgi:hypothetical protein
LIKYNLVTLAIISLFLFPILIGTLKTFSKDRIQRGFVSIFDNLEFIAGIFLSIFLTKKIFFENDKGVFKEIYNFIPVGIRNAIYGKDVLTYVVAVPIFLFILLLIVRLITNPLYNAFIIPLSNRLYNGLCSMSNFTRRIIGGVSQLPKAFFVIFLVGLMLNFYTYYFYSPVLAKWMNESQVYQLIYKNTIYPILNSNIAKQIPVIVNNSFDKNSNQLSPDTKNFDDSGNVKDFISNLTGGNIRVIEYFNGVTLNDAIKPNKDIDNMAVKIVGNEKSDTKKAYLIYRWISKNIKYDYEKAKNISEDPRGISSGSIIAFETRKGICFDYSSLYVTMCKTAGLKVRLVTGLGYSGVLWGDHAWNQVFSSEENKWINVDTTFGSAGNYFDKPDFNVDHRQADVQGEWE